MLRTVGGIKVATLQENVIDFTFLWKSCGKPKTGQVYNCYKEARRAYRRACRNAIRTKEQIKFNNMNYLHKNQNVKKFWKHIWKCKPKVENKTDSIDIETLKMHFSKKISKPEARTTLEKQD